MGGVPHGFYFQCVILNSGAWRSEIQNLLQSPLWRHSGLRAGVPCEIERVLKLFSPLQFVQLCDSGSEPGMTKNRSLPTLTLPEQGRESSNTPSPDWGRSGWGVSRKGFTFNASFRPSSRSPLQVQKVLKLFSPSQSVQLCDSESSSG